MKPALFALALLAGCSGPVPRPWLFWVEGDEARLPQIGQEAPRRVYGGPNDYIPVTKPAGYSAIVYIPASTIRAYRLDVQGGRIAAWTIVPSRIELRKVQDGQALQNLN